VVLRVGVTVKVGGGLLGMILVGTGTSKVGGIVLQLKNVRPLAMRYRNIRTQRINILLMKVNLLTDILLVLRTNGLFNVKFTNDQSRHKILFLGSSHFRDHDPESFA